MISVLSDDGAVQTVQYYIITDSIELPPFRVAKAQTPQRLTPRRSETQDYLVDSEHLRRTMVKPHPPHVVEDDRENLMADPLPDVSNTPTSAPQSTIVQDPH
jgi:hypothetical protein